MNLISYSLFGTADLYWAGAIHNIKESRTYLPDFCRVFYIDADAPAELKASIEALQSEYNMQIHYVHSVIKDGPKWDLLLKRFLAASIADADVVLFRDADSRIRDREIAAVKAWMASDKPVHIMRDHPMHGTAILAGMWGIRKAFADTIKLTKLVDAYSNFELKSCDQQFLAEKVYPLVVGKALEHSSYGIQYSNQIFEFPTPLLNNEHVGQIVGADNNV